MVLPIEDDNPATRRPYVTVALIVICTLLYLMQHLLLPDGAARTVEMAYGLVPAVLTGQMDAPPEAWLPPAATLLTSMFLHLGVMHLAGNVLFLWVFGNNVEDAMGHLRFLAFYLLCGSWVAVAYAVANPGSPVPASGASGAVSGVLGAYLLLYPRARVALALPLGFINVHLGRFAAVWVLAGWFALQLLFAVLAAARAPGVGGWLSAFAVHVAGFVAGLLLVTIFKRRDVPLWRHY